MLGAFYIVTALISVGLIYLTYSWPELWPVGLIGVSFILAPYPLHRLCAGRHRARAWLLVGL